MMASPDSASVASRRSREESERNQLYNQMDVSDRSGSTHVRPSNAPQQRDLHGAFSRFGGRRRSSINYNNSMPAESAEAQAEARAQAMAESEAPLRELAKQLSRQSVFTAEHKGNGVSGPKGSASNVPPSTSGHGRDARSMSGGGSHHRRTSSSIFGSLFSHHLKTLSTSASKADRSASGASSSAPASEAASAADIVAAQTASAVGGPPPSLLSPRTKAAAAQLGDEPLAALDTAVDHLQQLEEGSSVGGAAAAAAAVSGKQMPWSNIPETPPILNAENRRSNLVNPNPQNREEFFDQRSEPELMIGEIRSVQITDEIALARKALVVICVSLIVAALIRRFAGPLSRDVNIIQVVGFVSTLLLSYPVIRFVVRFFAYIITTKASALLYKGNSFYFMVALHQDVSITIWSIAAVYVWIQLFPDWVYPINREAPPRNMYRYGRNLLECFLAYRVGVLLKNFVVLLVATTYLWRPYLQRVQSSILAQYILLLLTDYATKGSFNPEDQRFAIEMGRQGIKEGKKISLYAVSKAMGFIPRNKLGHAFFRELNQRDTLDSSRDARVLGRFLFDQLVFQSRPIHPASEPTPPPSPAPTTGRISAYLTKGANALGVNAGNTMTAVLSNRSLRSTRHSNARPGLPAAFLPSDKGGSSGCVSPKGQRPSSAGPGTGAASGIGAGQDDDAVPTECGGGGKGQVADRTSKKFAGGINASTFEPIAPSYREADADGGGGGGAGGENGGRAYAGVDAMFGMHIGHQLSAIQDDESQAGSVATSFTQSGSRRKFFGGEEHKEEVPNGGDGQAAERPIPRGTDDAAAFGERLAEVTAGSTRSFSTEEGDGARAGAGNREQGAAKANANANPNVPRPTSRRKRRSRTSSRDEDGDDAAADFEGDDGEGSDDVVLDRDTLCPGMEDELLDVAFMIFDGNGNDFVTREEMVLGVVNTFKDHRSLSHTLQDSEHIARKLGLIIMCIIYLILFFVFLSIWGADVVSLSVTFASFLIAFSFMIGSSASDLMTAVLFIFVSRVYDVGDRVHIYDGSGAVDKKPMDVTVAKVDLRTTAFRRWDEQIFYMPNHLLAGKTIVNIQRTADQWHEFMINVAATTPAEKLKKLQAVLKAFAESKDKAEGLHPRTGFSLVKIEDSTKLTIRITFRQRGNWQNMEKKWACQSMCTWAIKNACDSIGISYAQPELPVRMKNKMN